MTSTITHKQDIARANLIDSRLALSRHYEASGIVGAPVEVVFGYADDQTRFSSHMSQSSWRMGGGHMNIELDEGRGQKVGSRIKLSGRILGVSLLVDEIVTERTPPQLKRWETIETPRLLVIGHYRMGFEISPRDRGSLLRVFIDYALPEVWPARWLGHIFGTYYAKWCTRKMVSDAEKRFAATCVGP